MEIIELVYLSQHFIDVIIIFITLSGFIIGLGSVTVIDLHGFLARKSSYWTETTIKAHKVTKILIWIGILCLLIGNILMYLHKMISLNSFYLRLGIFLVLIINGLYLSLKISKELLKREEQGIAQEILPKNLQNKILISFLISFLSWWSMVLLFAFQIVK